MNRHTSQQIGGTLAELMEDDAPLPAVIRTLLCELDEPNSGNVMSLLVEALIEPHRERLIEHHGELVTVH